MGRLADDGSADEAERVRARASTPPACAPLLLLFPFKYRVPTENCV